MVKIAGPTDISMTPSYNLQMTARSSATVMAKSLSSTRARYTKYPAVILSNISIGIPSCCRYDHYWEDGDVVISEQWLSIHKRWEFKRMSERILHRIAFDYSKVII